MNVAMRLLNNWGYQEEATGGEGGQGGGGNSAAFNPSTVVTQGSGLFDQARQQQQEDNEDLNADPTLNAGGQQQGGQQQEQGGQQQQQQEGQSGSEGGDKDKGQQMPTKEDKTSQVAAQEASGTYTYKGIQVEIENKPEMVEAFKEKGLDIDQVNKELFSEDGLTAETREKLNGAFGKMAVDMYLQGWQSQHDAMVSKHELDTKAQEAEMAALANEAAGGKWDDTLAWAQKTLDDKEYKEYAEIINGGGKAMQLAVKELAQRAGVLGGNAGGLTPPAMSPRSTPLKPDASSAVADDYAISAEEYNKAITSRDYYKDPLDWDKRRRAGMAKGI